MKNLSILFIFCVFTPSSFAYAETQSQMPAGQSAAQEKINVHAPQWFLTPAVGVGSMGYSGDINDRLDFSNRTAPQFSLSLSTAVTDRLRLSGGFAYIQTGADTVSKISGNKTLFRDAYVGIPLAALLDVARFSGDQSAFYVKLGFTPAFMTSSKATFSNGTTEDSDNSSKTLFMGTAGIGTRIAMSPTTSFDLEAFYVQSLSNVITSELNTIHSNGVVVTAGVGFGL